MRRLLLKAWPLVAVVALTTVLALQIPRKALFFRPVVPVAPTSFGSFVVYDDAATYEAVLQKARMSWQLRGALGRTRESHVDAFDFVEAPPPLKPLALPDEFIAAHLPIAVDFVSVPLLPPSVADAAALVPVATPPAEGDEVRRRRAELLELPESLQVTE